MLRQGHSMNIRNIKKVTGTNLCVTAEAGV